MNDKYCRLLYEYAAKSVKFRPKTGYTWKEENLFLPELQVDLVIMAEMICLQKNRFYFEDKGGMGQTNEERLAKMKIHYPKYWDVVQNFVGQQQLTKLDGDIEKLHKQSARDASIFYKAEKNAEIKQKKRKFNELAESLGLYSRQEED